MKLEYLCKLEEWHGKIRRLIDDMILYSLGETERDEERASGMQVTDELDISEIQAEIQNITNEIDPYFGFSDMLYYELEANIMESPRPGEVVNLYKNRFRYGSQLYDEYEQNNILEYIKNGRLSETESNKIEKLYLMLTQCWEIFCEEMKTKIESATDGFWREEKDEEGARIIKGSKVRKILNECDFEEPPYLTNEEIQIFSQFPEYFKEINGKWHFIKKHGKGYHWQALGYLIGLMYGTRHDEHDNRLKKYFGANWRIREQEYTDSGSVRVTNYENAIKTKFDKLSASH